MWLENRMCGIGGNTTVAGHDHHNACPSRIRGGRCLVLDGCSVLGGRCLLTVPCGPHGPRPAAGKAPEETTPTRARARGSARPPEPSRSYSACCEYNWPPPPNRSMQPAKPVPPPRNKEYHRECPSCPAPISPLLAVLVGRRPAS